MFGNPGIRAVKELAPTGRESEEYRRNELHWDGTSFGPLDFEDFFCDPAGPSAARRPVGRSGWTPRRSDNRLPQVFSANASRTIAFLAAEV